MLTADQLQKIMPRLPAARTSMILTIQPIGSVLLGAILLSQDPSALQIGGCALIVAGLLTVTAGARARRRPSPA